MSVTCSRCASSNPKKSAFCAYCGNKLFLNGQAGQFIRSTNNRSVVNTLPPIYMSQQPMFLPVTAMQQQQANIATPIPASFYSGKEAVDQKAMSTHRILTGHGHLTTHYSWLLEEKHTQALLVRSATTSLFRQHTLSGLKITVERFWDRSHFEEREYIIVQRGIAAIFIYIAPTGRDLYLSRTTMVSPTISSVRVAIGSTLLLFLFIGLLLSSSTYSFAHASQLSNNSFYSTLLFSFMAQSSIPLFTLSLLFLCLLLCIRSCMHWFIEKDLWLLLRFNRLNALQIDEIAFLEQTADSIIHNAVKQLGLDATTILPPPLGYQHKQEIRSI